MIENLGLKIQKKNAQKVILLLRSKNYLNNNFSVERKEDYVLIPITNNKNEIEKLMLEEKIEFEFTISKFNSVERKKSIREILSESLTSEELSELITSFDTLGDLAIIEVPKVLLSKKSLIGKAILKVNRNIKVVCRKMDKTSGEFRTFPIEVIAGENRKEAIYKENKCIFKIKVGEVFFSPRLGSERKRISALIKKDEIIGAFFAGVGPFPIVFAKNTQMKKAIAIELNPIAVESMIENVILNKVEDKIEVIKGDVRKLASEKYAATFDRIVMPLPKTGETFLAESIRALKIGGIIHFYTFVEKTDPFTKTIEKIIKISEKLGKKVEILRKERVRNFSPSTIQIVVDFKVI